MLLVVHHFLLASLFKTYTILVVLFDLFGPSTHVRSVGSSIDVLLHLLGVDLISQGLVQLLMLGSIFVLLINILKMSKFVLLDALLDVLFFLPLLHLFAIVLDDVFHVVHDALDPFASLCHFFLSSDLLIKCNLHVLLNLVSIGLLDRFLLS